jgi:hypothetical protein
VVFLKFVAFVRSWLGCRELTKCRSFDSAEVRFAQDDRLSCDRNFRDRTVVRSMQFLNGMRILDAG